MTDRVALYLQDSHDLRDGLDYARYAEEKGFEERLNVIGLIRKNEKHYTSYGFHFINLN